MKKANQIKKVTCIGGGLIGSSWAIQFAMGGCDVTILIRRNHDKIRDQIQASLDSLVALEAISKEDSDRIFSSIHLTTDISESMSDADFVQENGPERLDVKQDLLAKAEEILPEDAIYASSTSGLLISDITRNAVHPERCIGAHPYNPPHLIPLVELTKSPSCTDETLALAKEFYLLIGKEPVILNKECKGFISNRLQMAIYREMTDLVARGVCSLEDIDRALLYGPGIRWAAFGHNMILQLGSANGIAGMFDLLGDTINDWMADMANWTTMDPDWGAFAQQEVNKEMTNLPSFMGNTTEECRAFRDKVLIEILKLHHKL